MVRLFFVSQDISAKCGMQAIFWNPQPYLITVTVLRLLQVASSVALLVNGCQSWKSIGAGVAQQVRRNFPGHACSIFILPPSKQGRLEQR